jgi:hypothetical protein
LDGAKLVAGRIVDLVVKADPDFFDDPRDCEVLLPPLPFPNARGGGGGVSSPSRSPGDTRNTRASCMMTGMVGSFMPRSICRDS